ncbi:efflux RND transporter periplasmic adaptor subunit [Pleurocapsales cyanobacterium LEGE 06147]|nr:efflux RND transporter periplasmic adaptor subunit [Pleurocapsales cyanobacterium LEGE 06147]
MVLGFALGQLNQSNQNWLSNLENFLANQSDRQLEIKRPHTGSILPVETISVNRVDSYQMSRNFTGSIVARYTSQLGFERSGQLIRISVEEGERVQTDSPLAYLDTKNLKAQQQQLLAQRNQAVAKLEEMQAGPRSETIAAARASVRNVFSQLELAERKRSRRERLYQQGAISREQFDEAASETSVLQASLDQAKSELNKLLAGTRSERIKAQEAAIEQLDASLANLEVELEKSILKAPFAGTVSARKVDEGTVVSPGQTVLSLVENRVEARIGVPISAAERIQLGSIQSLQVGQTSYQAEVSSILPVLDSSTRTLTIVLTLDESANNEVSPGQIARLEIAELIPTDGYWLPTTALVQRGRGLWSCYVLGKPAQLESTASGTTNTFHVQRRDVEILHTESDRVLVRGTLQSGDLVIANGTHRLVPEQLVRPSEKLP